MRDLVQFLEQLSEQDRKELERRVRVEVYMQKRIEHKCTPTHYCMEHKLDLCGECYLAHLRTMHQRTTLHALEKFNQQSFTTQTRERNDDIVDKYNARLYKEAQPKVKSPAKAGTSTKIKKDKSIEQFKSLVSALSLDELKQFYAQMKEESK